MTARVGWQPGDVSPEARHAAESAAAATGLPLGDWLSETVRSPIIRELGSLPPEDSAPAPTPRGRATGKVAAPEGLRGRALPRGRVTRLAGAGRRPAGLRSRRSSNPDPAISPLAAAVVVEGGREPILVRRLAGHIGSYEVVAGERRRLAPARGGRAALPAGRRAAAAAPGALRSARAERWHGDVPQLQ